MYVIRIHCHMLLFFSATHNHSFSACFMHLQWLELHFITHASINFLQLDYSNSWFAVCFDEKRKYWSCLAQGFLMSFKYLIFFFFWGGGDLCFGWKTAIHWSRTQPNPCSILLWWLDETHAQHWKFSFFRFFSHFDDKFNTCLFTFKHIIKQHVAYVFKSFNS